MPSERISGTEYHREVVRNRHRSGVDAGRWPVLIGPDWAVWLNIRSTPIADGLIQLWRKARQVSSSAVCAFTSGLMTRVEIVMNNRAPPKLFLSPQKVIGHPRLLQYPIVNRNGSAAIHPAWGERRLILYGAPDKEEQMGRVSTDKGVI